MIEERIQGVAEVPRGRIWTVAGVASKRSRFPPVMHVLFHQGLGPMFLAYLSPLLSVAYKNIIR